MQVVVPAAMCATGGSRKRSSVAGRGSRRSRGVTVLSRCPARTEVPRGRCLAGPIRYTTAARHPRRLLRQFRRGGTDERETE
ncbi:hypothetical protein HU200_011373 [Digitaria exilis]|uniref:Uncharacterized protein n=1 Tax=Digitaria exilis TaxID=1010633 RepID=A0A835FHW1_9POAL|nr:hypothetical protein HU200_011373 [Digitaria exilis]